MLIYKICSDRDLTQTLYKGGFLEEKENFYCLTTEL